MESTIGDAGQITTIEAEPFNAISLLSSFLQVEMQGGMQGGVERLAVA